MKSTAAILALALLGAPAAYADLIPPPPETQPAAEAAGEAAALLQGSKWGLELKSGSGEVISGEVAFLPGNRFTLAVRQAGEDREQTGSGIWGIPEAAADGAFVLVLDMLERDRSGEYDSDEMVSFSLKPSGDGVLAGALLDDDNSGAVTLTRR